MKNGQSHKKIDLSISNRWECLCCFFIFVACTYISLSSKIDIFLGNQEHPHDLLVDRSADCNDRRHPLHYCVQSPGQSTVYTVHECQSRSFVIILSYIIIGSWLLTPDKQNCLSWFANMSGIIYFLQLL